MQIKLFVKYIIWINDVWYWKGRTKVSLAYQYILVAKWLPIHLQFQLSVSVSITIEFRLFKNCECQLQLQLSDYMYFS